MINNDFIGTILPNLYIDKVIITDNPDYDIFKVEYSIIEILSKDIFSWSDMPYEALKNIKVAVRLSVNETDKRLSEIKFASSGEDKTFELKQSEDASIQEIFFSNKANTSINILEDSIFDIVNNAYTDNNSALNDRQAESLKNLIESAKGNLLKQYKSNVLSKISNEIKVEKAQLVEKLDLLFFIYYDFGDNNIPNIFGNPVHIKITSEEYVNEQKTIELKPLINTYKYKINDSTYYGPIEYKKNDGEIRVYDEKSFNEEDSSELIELFIPFERLYDERLIKVPDLLSLSFPGLIKQKNDKYFSKLHLGFFEKQQAERPTGFVPADNGPSNIAGSQLYNNGSLSAVASGRPDRPFSMIPVNPSIEDMVSGQQPKITSNSTYFSQTGFANDSPTFFANPTIYTAPESFIAPDYTSEPSPGFSGGTFGPGLDSFGPNPFAPDYISDVPPPPPINSVSALRSVSIGDELFNIKDTQLNLGTRGILFFDFKRFYEEHTKFSTINQDVQKIYDAIKVKIGISSYFENESTFLNKKVNFAESKKIEYDISGDIKFSLVTDVDNDYPLMKIEFTDDRIFFNNFFEKNFTYVISLEAYDQNMVDAYQEYLNFHDIYLNYRAYANFNLIQSKDKKLQFSSWENLKDKLTLSYLSKILEILGIDTDSRISPQSKYTYKNILKRYIEVSAYDSKNFDPGRKTLYTPMILKFFETIILRLEQLLGIDNFDSKFMVNTYKYFSKLTYNLKKPNFICLTTENKVFSSPDYLKGLKENKIIYDFSSNLSYIIKNIFLSDKEYEAYRESGIFFKVPPDRIRSLMSQVYSLNYLGINVFEIISFNKNKKNPFKPEYEICQTIATLYKVQELRSRDVDIIRGDIEEIEYYNNLHSLLASYNINDSRHFYENFILNTTPITKYYKGFRINQNLNILDLNNLIETNVSEESILTKLSNNPTDISNFRSIDPEDKSFNYRFLDFEFGILDGVK